VLYCSPCCFVVLLSRLVPLAAVLRNYSVGGLLYYLPNCMDRSGSDSDTEQSSLMSRSKGNAGASEDPFYAVKE
jgi:hypothetical protein